MTDAQPQDGITVRMLTHLRDVGDATSREINDALNPYPHLPDHRARSWIANFLYRNKEYGRVRQVGTVPAEYHNVPSYRWQITEAGRHYLARKEAGSLDRTRVHQMDPHGPSHRTSDELLMQLDAEAQDKDWGPHTPVQERVGTAIDMYERGASYQVIADFFGVSRETIRLDVQGLNRSSKIRKELRENNGVHRAAAGSTEHAEPVH